MIALSNISKVVIFEVNVVLLVSVGSLVVVDRYDIKIHQEMDLLDMEYEYNDIDNYGGNIDKNHSIDRDIDIIQYPIQQMLLIPYLITNKTTSNNNNIDNTSTSTTTNNNNNTNTTTSTNNTNTTTSTNNTNTTTSTNFCYYVSVCILDRVGCVFYIDGLSSRCSIISNRYLSIYLSSSI
jgi:hypothetical protein